MLAVVLCGLLPVIMLSTTAVAARDSHKCCYVVGTADTGTRSMQRLILTLGRLGAACR